MAQAERKNTIWPTGATSLSCLTRADIAANISAETNLKAMAFRRLVGGACMESPCIPPRPALVPKYHPADAAAHYFFSRTFDRRHDLIETATARRPASASGAGLPVSAIRPRYSGPRRPPSIRTNFIENWQTRSKYRYTAGVSL